MRFLIGLALLVMLAAALTAGGFAVFQAFRGRQRAALAWTVIGVAAFTAQCGAGVALRPNSSQLAAAKASPAPSASTSPSAQPSGGFETPPSTVPADPCRHPPNAVATTLALASFGRILADTGSCHVLLSSPADNEIVVVDYSGNVVSTINGEYGADAMVISGATLYVVLTGTGSIDEIDLHTLKRIKTLASGLVKPSDLALTGGRLWTTTGACGQSAVKLAGVDLSTGAVSQYAPDASTNLSYCIRYAPATPGSHLLVAWDQGLEPANITTFDVSSGAPVLLLTQREEILGNLGDAVITSSNKLVTASGAPYEFDQWKLSDLRQDGVVYPGTPYPVAVATAAGRVVTGCATGTGWNVPAVRVFAVDEPAALASFLQASPSTDQLYRRGLALSNDGRLAFAVTGVDMPDQHSVTLRVLPVD